MIYVEAIFLENFIVDYCLLYGTKKLLKSNCYRLGMILVSLIGAVFSIAYPLLRIEDYVFLPLRLFILAFMCIFAIKCKLVRTYISFTCIFLCFYSLNNGVTSGIFVDRYGFCSVPFGGKAATCGLLLLFSSKISSKFVKKFTQKVVSCTIVVGQNQVNINGIFDSGNNVFYRGQPVSIIDSKTASKLLDTDSLSESTCIFTAAGSSRIKIFTADKIVIYYCSEEHIIEQVKVGISPKTVGRLILHTHLSEVN